MKSSDRPKFVVLSGAGISAESGLKTFRDSDGLWEGHRVEDVATPEAWYRDREKVLRFYNERRKAVLEASPNEAHKLLAALEEKFDITVITQNIDNLHEKAGSKKVLHLHGEIFKSRSTKDQRLIYDIRGWELNEGDMCELGSQLRPHIVWFGEAVPMMEEAISQAKNADYFLVIGTSLAVYPAAGLVDYVPVEAKKFLIDPKIPPGTLLSDYTIFAEGGASGMKKLFDLLNQGN
jgi:NAD-dependent deacetylase